MKKLIIILIMLLNTTAAFATIGSDYQHQIVADMIKIIDTRVQSEVLIVLKDSPTQELMEILTNLHKKGKKVRLLLSDRLNTDTSGWDFEVVKTNLSGMIKMVESQKNFQFNSEIIIDRSWVFIGDFDFYYTQPMRRCLYRVYDINVKDNDVSFQLKKFEKFFDGKKEQKVCNKMAWDMLHTTAYLATKEISIITPFTPDKLLSNVLDYAKSRGVKVNIYNASECQITIDGKIFDSSLDLSNREVPGCIIWKE